MNYLIPSSSSVPAPFLEIEISDLLDKKKRTVQALIDTGYDGELLIPINLYRELNLGSFESSTEKTMIAETLTGEPIDLRSSVGTVRLLSLDISITSIIDTNEKFDEIIIGRIFLENFILSLNGCKKQLLIEICLPPDDVD